MKEREESGLIQDVRELEPRSMSASAADGRDGGSASPDRKRGSDSDGTDGGDSDGTDSSDNDGTDGGDSDGTDSGDNDGTDGDSDGTDH